MVIQVFKAKLTLAYLPTFAHRSTLIVNANQLSLVISPRMSLVTIIYRSDAFQAVLIILIIQRQNLN